MKKQYSGSKVLMRMFLCMVAVSLLGLLICGSYALRSTQQELMYCSDAVVNLYFNGVSHILSDLSSFSENLYGSNADLLTYAQKPGRVSENQLLQAKYNLRQAIHNRISANTGILIFNEARQERYYLWGQEVWQGAVSQDTIHMVEAIHAFWSEQPEPEGLGWQILTVGEKSVVMQAKRYRDVIVCTALDISSYAAINESGINASTKCAFLSTDQILTGKDYADRYGITLETMLLSCDTPQYANGHILQARLDADAGFGVCCMNSTDGIWGSWWNFVLLLVLSLIVICIVSFAIFGAVKKMLIYPINKITEISNQIQSGVFEIQKTPERFQEIDDIQNALVTLVEQKITLETEKSREEAQKSHALLQYYQLQTRSHFLLNCLKSIYNLVARGELERTLRVVTRFSNHIRYVFHDSLTFVPIRAELDEVDDYFEIIGLERTDHILLTKNVDPKLMDFPIPPLLIQTFVENFQKHNIQSDKVLCFNIKIDHLQMEGHKYVRIRLSDNGIGYSEDALAQLQQMDGTFAQFHVGIQNLCRRIDILYRKQHKTAFFNLPKGGACSVFYFPADSYLADEPVEEALDDASEN